MRAFGAQHVAREDAFHGDVIRHALGQAQQATARCRQAAFHFGQTELGGARRDHQIAGEHDFKAARERVAFDRCDHGFARWLDGDAAEAATGDAGALALQKALQIHARAERAARADDDADAECRIRIERIDGGHHGFGHFQRHGVLRFGAIERHDLDVAANLYEQWWGF